MTVIIGGGASGMFAALCAVKKNPEVKIKIIERMDRVGKKLLATGNGCCNFTNLNLSESSFHSHDIETAWSIAKSFPPESVIEFFKGLGVLSAADNDGRVYPYSYQASAVLDCIRFTLNKYGVEVITDMQISRLDKKRGAFVITSVDKKSLTVQKVIVASGGMSYKSLGSDGSGFELLRQMGHTITKTSPALTQLITEAGKTKSLDGIKLTARLGVSIGGMSQKGDGKVIFSQYGDVLFTSYGISGPPALAASSLLHEYGGESLTAHLDFMPDYSEREITGLLYERKDALKHLPMEDFFTGMLNKRVGMLISKLSGIEKFSQKADSLNGEQIRSLVARIKDFRINITGTKGFETSQVTAGGALLSEFNPATLESKKHKGLYAVGEVLDVYGDCGGYNLHWAWASGRCAGLSLASIN